MTLVCGDDTVQCLSMMESEIEIYQVDTQSVWMINKHITHNLYSHFIRSITVANIKQIKECNYIAYVSWKFRLPESLITADCVVFYTKVNYRHRLIALKCVFYLFNINITHIKDYEGYYRCLCPIWHRRRWHPYYLDRKRLRLHFKFLLTCST